MKRKMLLLILKYIVLQVKIKLKIKKGGQQRERSNYISLWWSLSKETRQFLSQKRRNQNNIYGEVIPGIHKQHTEGWRGLEGQVHENEEKKNKNAKEKKFG